jgi:hypothetical protein
MDPSAPSPIAALTTALRVAEAQAGQSPVGPWARDLAVELLQVQLGCPWPSMPLVTEQSADRARETLTR